MRRTHIIVLFAAAISISGCNKNWFSKYQTSLSADYEISMSYKDSEGNLQSITANATDLKSDKEAAYLSLSNNQLTLTLGTNEMLELYGLSLMATIDFVGVDDPFDIIRAFNFPGDNKLLKVTIYSHDGHYWKALNNPEKGELSIQYDELTRTWKGKLSNVQFPAEAAINDTTWSANFKYIPGLKD